MSKLIISRRTFLSHIATASAVATFPITLGGCREKKTLEDNTEILYWVTINSDNSVTFKIPQSEIGQAVTTTISQLLAEELEVEWSSVNTEFYDPNTHLDNNNVYVWTATLGSMSAHYLFDPARVAGAQIRTMLIKAAALHSGWDESDLVASENHIHHKTSGKMLSYAGLATTAVTMTPPPSDQLKLKSPQEWTLVGNSMDRVDLKPATNGSVEYGIDIELPGMRHAAIRQCPVFGGTLQKLDETGLANLSGSPVTVRLKGGHVGYNSPVPEGEDPDLWATPVTTSDAVAVVADTWWQAKQALDTLRIVWNEGDNKHSSSDNLQQALSKKLDNALPFSVSRGDVPTAMKTSAQTHSAEYMYPFMDPAPMEPMNCTALVKKSSADVWSGSQYADEALRTIAKLTGLPRKQVNFNLMSSGGGFGRRAENDYIYQAVQIAMEIPGTPIKLLWSREESIQKSFYAPLTMARYEGAIDEGGEISAWVCRVASCQGGDQAYGATEFPFHFPNSQIEYNRDTKSPIPFGWMRGVGYTQHLWMNFGFLDELARLAGRDPADVYRAMLHESKVPSDIKHYEIAVERAKTLRRVLEKMLALTEWSTTNAHEGSGRGIAVSDTEYYAGYGATSSKAAVVDVTINAEGKLSLDKVFIVIDCGTVINPDVVRAQLEGGVAYALTNALHSEITVKDGKVQQSNFHDYPVLKIHEMPSVVIEILPGTGAPLSVGEDSVPITIAALVNAIADAGGPRIRNLPIKMS
ncbi:molybdopterin cofactor-binding domain-containing protein [Dasania marina]|uniref:xanthine dehydrogenase family protein molybdopterin-binding subunit n=1 Tax=Dasania marina TaxID=471499 RepID=UPI0030D6D93C|tara:strand:+ start:13351 stop:15600 length:2250 start_codon:yes stop_codon:yes gene_type:complete